MFRRVLVGASLLALTACLPIPDGNGIVAKACTEIGYESNIVFNVESSDADLPDVISGMINDTYSFDECQTSSSPVFKIERLDARHAIITIFVAASKLSDQYFDEKDQPIPDQTVKYFLYGRRYCSDDPLTFQRGNPTLVWTPVEANGAGCGVDGYTSTAL